MRCADRATTRVAPTAALLEDAAPSAAGGLGHGSLNEVHQTQRQQRRRNDDVAQEIEALQVTGGTLRNDDAGDDRGEAPWNLQQRGAASVERAPFRYPQEPLQH